MLILSTLRIKIVGFWERLLLGGWTKPISKIIESIQISIPEIIIDSKKIRNADIVNYDYPPYFDSFFRPSRLFPDRYVFEIKDAIVIKEKGVITTSDHKILLESYGSVRKLLFWEDVRKYLFGRVKKINNNNVYYYLRYSGFYHFLLEEIPALLYALSVNINIKLLIRNKKYPEFFNASLKMVLGNNYDNKLLRISSNIRTDKLFFTQRDFFSGGIHINDVELLNKWFLPKIDKKKSLSKIYISRKKSKKRSIFNEDEIEKLMIENGFEVLYTENYSLKEQIELIQGADFIIGPHGAGLSHLVWKPEKKKNVIEIFPSKIKNDCYASLANSLGYNYNYIICEKIAENEFCCIELLKSKLNKMI